MKLLFKRNISDTIKKMLLCVFTLGGFAAAGVAQAQTTALPRLSLGVNSNFSYADDINKAIWYPDNRIWAIPKRMVTGDERVPESEILVPVFIDNRWQNYNNAPGVKLQELSSFSFRMYYDTRALEFVEVVKEHPYTAEEANTLASTHFAGGTAGAYYKPLAYNFNVVAAAPQEVNDYGKYFHVGTVPATDAAGKYYGRTVTVTGTANSFYNLEPTGGLFKVLVYLRFRVANAYEGVTSPAAARSTSLYFDPTYICFNGINIAKDRGDKLIEQMPLTNADNNWNGYVNMFGTLYFNNYINKTNDNVQYFDTTWSDNIKTAEITQKSTGLNPTDHNWALRDKYRTEPYLPGSIRVRVMNYIPEFNFEAVNYAHTNIVPPAVNIRQDAVDRSKWVMLEPITADILQTQRLDYKNQSERAIRVSIESNKSGATGLATDQYFVMEDIIVETDQPWLRVRTAIHNGDATANFENKFSSSGSYDTKRRAFAQRINRLITIPNRNEFNPLAANTTTTNPVPKEFIMWVECDPAQITPRAPGSSRDQDFCGEYIGHVTFRSKYDKYEKTSIEVRFIVIASPEEVTEGLVPNSAEVPYGLKLSLTPYDGKRPDLTKTLILGSSNYATDQADSLAGEYVLGQPLGFNRNGVQQEFDARLFIDAEKYPVANFIESGLKYKDVRTHQDTLDLTNQWNSLVANGFGDYTHYDGVYNAGLPGGVTDNKQSRTSSRDIRSATGTGQSNIHYVQFKVADDNTSDWFPAVLKWDPKQLQGRNTCHLKYIHNGGTEILDMKTTSSYVFHDIHVNHFWIEYTVAQSDNYVDIKDNFGDDIILANTWNLISLPLDPVNKRWEAVYEHATDAPYHYTIASNWNAVPEMQPGVGYFIKYSTIVDSVFQGAYIDRVDSTNYPVVVQKGDGNGQYWNLIGSLSKVVSIDNINFDPYETYAVADKVEMLKNGVWAYRPKQGYKRVYHLYPGKGYFIKVNSYSRLNINGTSKSTFDLPTTGPNLTAGFDMINITDASQNAANIFATKNADIAYFGLPPAPPASMFDVRFAQNNYVTTYDEPNNLVKMQGVTYPVTVNFDKPRATYTVVDPITNEVYGKVKAGTTTNIVINDSRSNAFKLVAEASNETFFVNVSNNPVNTNTAEITLGIDTDVNVTIAVYNTLGNEVAKLDLGYLNAGVFNRTIDVTGLAAGAYTVRMLAGNEVKTFMMNIIK